MTNHIDDLCIKNISAQQQFIGFELCTHRVRVEQHECALIDAIDEFDIVMFKPCDLVPIDERERSPSDLDKHSRHQR